MNYNFTDGVRKALAMAREEAIRLQHDYVGTEHMLLGLIREGEEVASVVLLSLSVDLEQVRERVEQSVRRGKATIALGELPYSSRGKKVLEFAMAEARELNHSCVGTEHLLLGLLREEKGIAAEVLNELGVSLEYARREVVQLLGAPSNPRPPFSIRIDDTSSISIRAQIVSEIQESIAVGRLHPGERLPTVRQLADLLDIAPGTVTRAYHELEQLGVIVTRRSGAPRVADRTRTSLPDTERGELLVGLLRPIAMVAGYSGATALELRAALEQVIEEVFGDERRPE